MSEWVEQELQNFFMKTVNQSRHMLGLILIVTECPIKIIGFVQGWDEYCPAGKFQWNMPEISGMANTPKITEVANTGIYE